MRNQDGGWETYVDDVLDFALDRLRAGERVALVTLVMVDGSSPRPPGAQMVVSETGQWVGYLSGGCLERAVVAEALAAIEEGSNRRVRYGRGSKYFDIQLPCGSAIELIFDVQVSQRELEAVLARLNQRQPACLRVSDEKTARGDNLPVVRRYLPRRRLIVAGVGPAAVLLGRLGIEVGYEVVLYSPDGPTRQALERSGVVTVAIRSAAGAYVFDADLWTAIVFMFHDHVWERDLIPAALATSAFYIGAMGSKSAHRVRLKMLEEMGLHPDEFSRIKGPCGLFASAKSAQSIAISILAEILQLDHSAAHESLEMDDASLLAGAIDHFEALPAHSHCSLGNKEKCLGGH